MRTTGHLLWHRVTTRPDAAAARSVRAPMVPPTACSRGIGSTAARSRGATRAIRIASSCRRSCCNRRRSIACCRSTSSGSIGIRRSRRSPSAARATSSGPGIRSATTSGRGACTPSRARPSSSYGGQLPDDEASLRSFKGIGAYTAGAVMSFAFGKRAAILDTNVARVLSRVFVGAERDERSREREAPVDAFADRPAPSPRLRLQSGAHGFRRHGLQRAVAALRAVPDAIEVPDVSVHRRRTASNAVGAVSGGSTSVVVVVAAVIETRRDGCWSRDVSTGTHLAGLWEFPGGKCEPGEAHDACLARELIEELGVDSTIGDELLVTEHAYPERTVRLHFRHATIAGEPQPLLGQELKWIARRDLRPAQFPGRGSRIDRAAERAD